MIDRLTFGLNRRSKSFDSFVNGLVCSRGLLSLEESIYEMCCFYIE